MFKKKQKKKQKLNESEVEILNRFNNDDYAIKDIAFSYFTQSLIVFFRKTYYTPVNEYEKIEISKDLAIELFKLQLNREQNLLNKCFINTEKIKQRIKNIENKMSGLLGDNSEL